MKNGFSVSSAELVIYLLEEHPGALLWAPVPNHPLLADGMDAGGALDAAPGLDGAVASLQSTGASHAMLRSLVMQLLRSQLVRETWASWWYLFPCSGFGSPGGLQV